MEPYDVEYLLREAKKVEANAHAPYSNKANGAALLTADGRVFVGCTVENAAYPTSVCAAKAVLVQAISAGARQFTAIVISGDGVDDGYLCGDCRQAFAEFGLDLEVISERNPLEAKRLADLLPDAFVEIRK